MIRYNHMYDVAFTVINDSSKGEATIAEELLDTMQDRVDYLRKHPDEVIESCGAPSDTYSFGETADDN